METSTPTQPPPRSSRYTLNCDEPVFPWMLALSAADRKTCAQELVDAARASFSTNQPHLAIAELTSWKETATAIAAGLGTVDLEWFDDADDDTALSVNG